ncbi:MAG: SDR family oxidoreductase [Planctomycetaceae bacterium]
MRTFDGKTAFLTGAASGIGRELARRLAEEGCHLYLVDIDADGLRALAEELAHFGQHIQTDVCDLSQLDQVQEMLQRCDGRVDRIDLLINNAGVAYYGPTDAMTQQQWDWLMNINLLAPLRITQHFLPQLMTRPDAHVVNMCSISGLVAGGRFAAYHTSKYGLVGFTEALRAEYGRKGIGVTAICPGPVKTNLYQAAASGRQNAKVPTPPNWLCASPERVAELTLRGIRRNRRQVLITPLAHGLFQLKRFVPGLLDFASQFSRKKKARLAILEAEEQERLRQLQNPDHSESQSQQKAA